MLSHGKRFFCLLSVMIFLTPTPSLMLDKPSLDDKLFDDSSKLTGGWLEEHDSVKILHVSGTNYEMGYQHGYLLKDEIEENYRAIFTNDHNNEIYNFVLDAWNRIIKHHTPQEYIDEMQGLADGSGRPIEDVIVYVVGPDYFIPINGGCTEIAAWNSSTVDGKLRHLYSSDWFLQIRDPESGTYLQENQLIMIRKPENGHASLQFFYAGGFTGYGGVNEHEIAISMDASGSTEFTLNATFFWLRVLMVLDHASSATEAINIMNVNRNGRMNYIISDGKIPIAFVCEEAVNCSYVGTWDDETESLSPFWQIENVVRRKNMYINPDTARTQRPFYDPRIFYLNSIYTGEDYFNTWRYYKTISEKIEQRWGTLDNENMIFMARSIYRAETDKILKLYGLLGLDQFPSHHQWVVCSATGDIVMSFADGNKQAQYNNLHYFNFYELLDAEPP